MLCLDETNIQSLIPRLQKKYITYGLLSQADYTARNITFLGLDTWFEVVYQGRLLGKIHSVAPGRHNVLNTLAAVAVGMELNLTFAVIATALKGFTGVQRRFEILQDTPALTVVDDYGHHPVEVQVTLRTAKEVWPTRRLVVVFQPHRYSRTQTLLKQFWSAFNDADCLIVAGIFAAGEEPIEGVSAQSLADGIKNFGHKNVECIENLSDSLDTLVSILQPGDVLFTLGAGNVWELGRDLLANLPERLRKGNPGKETR